MPNKKKKTPVTGYSIFVREMREKYQRQGCTFPKNNQDAFNFAGPMWKKLSEEEKTRYNNMAKEEKRLGGSDLECKFNSQGVSFAELEAERREKEEYMEIMLNTIHNTVQQSDFNTTFKTVKFHLCHVNFFYVNSCDRFKPAEIALCEFTLKNGVLSRFQAFINPGPVETGYRFEAKRKLEETHQIPIDDPNWTLGEKDYVKLFYEIKTFLCKDNPSGRIPPIYTMPDDEKNNFSMSAVKSTIETLCEASNEEPSEFRIYSLPELYHELRIKALTESPLSKDQNVMMHTKSLAIHELEKDKFCYTKGIACQFHEERDIGNFCSLSMVTRLVYSMCDYLLNYIPDEIIPGAHAPKDCILAKKIYNKGNSFQDDGPLRRPNLSQASEVDEDGFQLVNSKRKSNLNQPQAHCSRYPASSTIPPQDVSALASSFSSQLRFQPPQRPTFVENDDDIDPPSRIYEDGNSAMTTPNLSQTTSLSGYNASVSLTQSSLNSDMGSDTLRFFGRGRGMMRRSPDPTAGGVNQGRGSRLRGANQQSN